MYLKALKVDQERQFIKQPLRVGDMTFGSHIFFTLFLLIYLISCLNLITLSIISET